MSTKSSLLYKKLKLKNGKTVEIHIYNDFANGLNPSQMCIEFDGCGIAIQADIREEFVPELKDIDCGLDDNE